MTVDLKQLLEDIRTPAELRTLLEAPGVTDQVVEEFVAAVGTQKVLDRVFGLMGEHFVAARAGGQSGVVQWNVGASGGEHVYHVTIAGGRARGRAARPTWPG